MRKARDDTTIANSGSAVATARPSAIPKSIEPLLTLMEAASVLKVCVKTLRREISRGVLPVVRIGRALRIRPADLRQYMNERWNG